MELVGCVPVLGGGFWEEELLAVLIVNCFVY